MALSSVTLYDCTALSSVTPGDSAWLSVPMSPCDSVWLLHSKNEMSFKTGVGSLIFLAPAKYIISKHLLALKPRTSRMESSTSKENCQCALLTDLVTAC